MAAEGSKHLRGVVLGTAQGERRIACDALVLSLGLAPRDGLLRMGDELPIVGAGDVVVPGCTPDEAAQSGAAAGTGDPSVPPIPASFPWAAAATSACARTSR